MEFSNDHARWESRGKTPAAESQNALRARKAISQVSSNCLKKAALRKTGAAGGLAVRPALSRTGGARGRAWRTPNRPVKATPEMRHCLHPAIEIDLCLLLTGCHGIRRGAYGIDFRRDATRRGGRRVGSEAATHGVRRGGSDCENDNADPAATDAVARLRCTNQTRITIQHRIARG